MVHESRPQLLRHLGRGRYEEKEKRLKELVRHRGLKMVGKPVFARDNPLFMPWLLRRHEVMIPVAR
jgi:hypothetical protein